MLCPVCGNDLTPYATADYYLPGSPHVITNIFCCQRCEALVRAIPPQQIHDHCSVASYTNLANEVLYRRQRDKYFIFLFNVIRKYFTKQGPRCLDFGCSYGHFMEVLRSRGWNVTGVEFVAPLREYCAAKGLVVFESLEALKNAGEEEPFGLIALIDVLYHLSDPNPLMTSLRKLLRDDGVLLIRVTNRYGLTRLLKHVFRRSHFRYQMLGDATVTYSKKTMDRLLANHGFTVVERRYWEGGKREKWKFTLFSLLTVPLCWITGGRIMLTPGLTVLAKKVRPQTDVAARERTASAGEGTIAKEHP